MRSDKLIYMNYKAFFCKVKKNSLLRAEHDQSLRKPAIKGMSLKIHAVEQTSIGRSNSDAPPDT
jgi:hypothetical protein